MANRSALLLIIAFGALLFGANVWGYDLWPADEPRFAEVAREMIWSGDYLAPHVNGMPYREKPPLLFWLIAAVSAPFGEVNEWTGRIPSVASAIVVLICTYLLARGLYGGQVAFWSVIVLATCTRFWWQARTAQIDMLLTACLAVALLCFWRWHTERRSFDLACFYAAIAAAVYAKGPPGLVFPLLLILAFYWKQPAERRKSHWVLGTLGVIVAIAFWLIPARVVVAGEGVDSAQADIAANLFRQTIGRFLLGVSHAEWPWYYLENLPVDLAPWILFAPYTAIYVWRRRREGPEMRLLLSWTVPAFIFFSISIGKRALYLLPIYPALAILIARSVLDLMASARPVWRKRTAWVWAAFLLLLAVGPFIIPFTAYAEAWRPRFIAITAAAAVFAGHALYLALRTDGSALHRAVAGHIVVFEVLVAFIALPAINPYKSARDFCAPMRALNAQGVDYELYSVGFSREEYIFYSERFHDPLLYGLLDIKLPRDLKNIDPISLQIEARDALSEATEDFEVGSYAAMTPQTREQLEHLVDGVLAQSGAGPRVTEFFLDALRADLAPLEGKGPTLVMVQQEDYKWLLPVAPVFERFRVLDDTSVGSREVLLLANDAAVGLLESTSAGSPLETRRNGG